MAFTVGKSRPYRLSCPYTFLILLLLCWNSAYAGQQYSSPLTFEDRVRFQRTISHGFFRNRGLPGESDIRYLIILLK